MPFFKSSLNVFDVIELEIGVDPRTVSDFLIEISEQEFREIMSRRTPRAKNYNIGVLAGAFDVIHPGYIYLFRDAKRICKHLVIALYVNPNYENPSKLRPIFSSVERIEILKSIRYVDMVVPYRTEEELSEILLNADVRINGNDHEGKSTRPNLEIPTYYHNRNHHFSSTKVKKMIRSSLPNKFPKLIIVSGTPSSGKSSLSKELAAYFNAKFIDIDDLQEPPPFTDVKQRNVVYENLHEKIENEIQNGNNVVACATYAREDTREMLLSTIHKIEANVSFVECKISPTTAVEMFRSRMGHSAKDLSEERVFQLAQSYSYSNKGIIVNMEEPLEKCLMEAKKYVERYDEA